MNENERKLLEIIDGKICQCNTHFTLYKNQIKKHAIFTSHPQLQMKGSRIKLTAGKAALGLSPVQEH
jgi:hypothetical protein